MKILFVNVDCGVGSTGRICSNLARYMISKGHKAVVAYGRNCSTHDKDISYRVGNDLDIKFHAFFSRIFDKSGFYSKVVTKHFIKWIDDFKPDIVNLHNLHGYFINFEILMSYLAKKNIKVYYTLHDCWLFTGHCAYFDFVGCNKWKESGCNKCPQKKTYPKSIFLDRSSKNFETKKSLVKSMKDFSIITPSLWLANLAKESFLSDREIYVIHNGIDTNVFKPLSNDYFLEKYGIPNKRIVLGVASPWSPRKGFRDFIKLSKIINSEFIVVMIGLSEKQLSVLPPNIIGLGKTDTAEELALFYSKAFVFFNPTYEDNYPTTNLEAAACGCPVITYNTGGSIESVPDEQVVEKGEINRVKLLIEKGRLQIYKKESFDYKEMAEKYLSLFLGC